MITVTLYASQLEAILELIEIDDDNHPAFRALRGGYRRLKAARDAMPHQPLDAELDALTSALMSLHRGAFRDEVMARLRRIHTQVALWFGCEHLPLDHQRRLLRLDRIDNDDWMEQARDAIEDHHLFVALPPKVCSLTP